jgi:glycosyltransferase involved in cell wall biosynthesis
MHHKIRLMQITHDLAIGGLQQVVVNLCMTINRDIFDVQVLCLRELGSFVPDVERLGISVMLIPQEDHTDYFAFLKVAKILRDEKIDVIHTHNTQPFVEGTLAAMISGVKTIVHTDHAREFPDKKRYMFAEWAASHFAYKVVGVSEHTSHNLLSYENIAPRKIVTIPNGIDGTRFNIGIDKERKRRELGITNDGQVIGLGVRLSEQKGISYLLRAMPEIVRQMPGVTLVIAGEGPLEDDLKHQMTELGVADYVRFVGSRLDIPELLKLFDLYVLPSLWEGLPMVLLEAMAAGCPIVATDVGGVSMAIQSGVNGTLVKPRDPEALSAAIVALLKDDEMRLRYAQQGQVIFLEKFSAEIMTRRYEELYQRQR